VPETDAELIAQLGDAFGTPGQTPEPATYVRSTEPGPTETTEDCQTTQLTGTYDGQPIDELYSWGGTATSSGSPWYYSVGLATGSASVSGPAAIDGFDELDVGTTLVGNKGTLVLPKHLQGADRPACVTGATAFTKESNHAVLELGGIGYLSPCDQGAPVDGELNLCLGDTCAELLSGQLAGTPVPSSSSYSYSSGSTSLSATLGSYEFRLRYEATDALHANVKDAWITDKSTGEVYCAGAASTATASGEIDDWDDLAYKRTVTLTGLRSVGNCANVTGTDNLTVRACKTW